MALAVGFFTKIFRPKSRELPVTTHDTQSLGIDETERLLRRAQQGIASLITALHRVESGLNVNSITDPEERERMQFRLDFLRDEKLRVLSENEMDEADLIGREFTTALKVTAINAAEFPPDCTLWISSVLEPLIMAGDETIREGRVTVSVEEPHYEEGVDA